MRGLPFKITLKKDVQPWAMAAPRCIPYPHIAQVKEELERMEALGVIKRVDEPTDWCHPIVVVPTSNNKVRLCLYLTKLSAQVGRQLRVMETVEDMLARTEGATVFTKLDANSGFWQVPLDEGSHHITTFITPFGRYCCLRAPFGINSLPEHFSERMDK